jgi:hypothetical protein
MHMAKVGLGNFIATFEDVGFTNDKRLGGLELSEASVAIFNAKHGSNEGFPQNVVKLLSAYVAEDDHQGPTDIKVFVSVDFLVKARNLDSAQDFAPPAALLQKVQEELLREASAPVDMQGHWETLMALEPEAA